MSPMASPMPGFHHHPPGGPMSGPHHPMYIGLNGQGLVPSQPMGYGYQLQFMPGMRPSAGSANFMMPYSFQRQNQPGPRAGFRRGATNMQQQQMMQQNVSSGMRYMGGIGNRRNGMEASAPQGMVMSMPMDSSAMSHNAPHHPHKRPILPISKLTSDLALASPQMLGENLYPLVEQHEPVHTAKVTGMLLEMDQAETPEALKAKVSKALDVLRLC